MPVRRSGLVVRVSTGVGHGPTKLAAFDAALHAAGAPNYNLIRLSSIIPVGTTVIRERPATATDATWGDRLYVVYADARVAEPNKAAYAGVGWWQDNDGKGVFAEHAGASSREVRRDLKATLTALLDLRRGDLRIRKSPVFHYAVIGETCVGEPVCAVALAAFAQENWLPSGGKMP